MKRPSSGQAGIALETASAFPLPGPIRKAVWMVVVRERRRLAVIVGATIAVQVLTLLPPQLTRVAIDRALPGGEGSVLDLIAVGLIAVGFSQAWTGWIRHRALLMMRLHSQALIERGLLDHLLRLPYAALNRRSVVDVMQAITGVSELRSLMTDRAVGMLLDAGLAFGYLAMMAWSMPLPTLGVSAGVAVLVVLAIRTGQRQSLLQQHEIEARQHQRASLIETLSGIATIKSIGAEEAVHERWTTRLRAQLVASLARQRYSLRAESLLEALRQTITLTVLFAGGYLALRRQTTLGTFVAFLQMSGGFVASASSLASAVVATLVSRPQWRTASEFAQLTPAASHIATPSAGPVIMEDVWFRYAQDGPWVMSGMQLTVQPGEKRGIRAPSGWGKTTMLRLLAGLYTPERGRVTIGGQDPTRARGLLLYVPQGVHLSAGTIFENLEVLSAYAPRARLLAAAEASGLGAFVQTLPAGYDTGLPSGAATLSGGQRQLVALTAAMASAHPVLLLDEIFVNLDGLSRQWLVDSPWFKGRTVIYVSHDTQFAS
jgi:ATP-binding cassette, subfamily B, bacterial